VRVEPGDRLGDDARNAATALSARVLHGRAEHRHRGRRPRAARRGGVVADSERTRRNGRRSLARTGRLARGSTARGERRGTRARASALEDRATRTRARRRDVRRARDRDSRRRRRARVSEIGGKRGPRMRIRIVSYEKTVSLMRTRKSPGAINHDPSSAFLRIAGAPRRGVWSSRCRPLASSVSPLPPRVRRAIGLPASPRPLRRRFAAAPWAPRSTFPSPPARRTPRPPPLRCRRTPWRKR